MDIILSDEEIDRLITIPKKIIQQPTKEDKQEGQHLRNDMRLLSNDGKLGFRVFFRRHAVFPEAFSIGLRYNPSDLKGEITIFRCNSVHNSTNRWDHHKSSHIHKVTARDLIEGRQRESDITETNEYNTYEQAVIFFVKHCKIDTSSCEYVVNLRQLSLFATPCIPKNK